MASTLPLPVRVAAGLLATGIDQLRRLPAELPELSVTVVGRAVRASMQLQHSITELAGRGEELLGEIFSAPTENPEWARFDEDEAEDGPAGPAGPAGLGGETGGEAATGAAGTGEAEAGETAGDSAGESPDSSEGAGESSDFTPDMPGYDELRLAQVRARMRALTVPALERLLAHEREHQARAPFLTMLTNRIATVEAEDAAADHWQDRTA